MLLRTLVLGLGLLAPAGPPAGAEPQPRLAVDWPAAPGCPSAEDFELQLRELAPALELTDDTTSPLQAQVTLEHDASPGQAERWRTTLELQTPIGRHREAFEAESCAVAADAAALLIAVLLDPVAVATQLEALTARPPTQRPRQRDQSPPPTVEPEATTPQSPEATPQPRLRDPLGPPDARPFPALNLSESASADAPSTPLPEFGLALLGGGGYGPLRAGAGVIAGAFIVADRGWRWELRGAWLPPVLLDLDQGWSAHFDGWLVGTRGCGEPRTGPALSFPLCAGIEVGAVRGRPLDTLAGSRDANQPWLAIEAGPGLRWVPGPQSAPARVAIGAEVDAVASLFATGFSLDGSQVRQYAPVGVRALAVVELRLDPRPR
ncbi:hypothetical protein PPSIR1_19334 [Plesiocystis pacifica SIR-1]|uniref:Uncharacterized protein n=1 Tax=Plesiocystis pacifica SIR-1 TaxID=391625 RepID=A6G832_9BACT|nr:hypothetical protein [Plesiocystis pacifica]EDM77994.1 hypothetical protein PPSIR1_19334 [Plesiocystis pacifica SIR-1]